MSAIGAWARSHQLTVIAGLAIAAIVATVVIQHAGASKGTSRRDVPVSPECATAMRNVSELPNPTNAEERAAELPTLTDCKTADEWFTAVKPYTTSVPEPLAGAGVPTQHCIVCAQDTPEEVYKVFCEGEAAKPACQP